jgi:hypothetical protein
MSPKREEGVWGVLANECSCAHGAQINLGDLTPYLTYASTLFVVNTDLDPGISLKPDPDLAGAESG